MSEHNNYNSYIILSDSKTVWGKLFRKNTDIGHNYFSINRKQIYNPAILIVRSDISLSIIKWNFTELECYNYNTYSAGVGIACRNKYFCEQFISGVIDKFITYYFNEDKYLIKSYNFLKIPNTTNANTETTERYWVA